MMTIVAYHQVNTKKYTVINLQNDMHQVNKRKIMGIIIKRKGIINIIMIKKEKD